MPQEVSITRMAVTNEKDLEKERTMGRKAIVPYGLYRAEGYISAPFAEKTGLTKMISNFSGKRCAPCLSMITPPRAEK